ncbi:MAG TPA: CidA/LrgA family protein [Candidatus Gallacutalibacter pullistercoris]|nr:CidA/LrgA family protein [Candidatus Gallacutalibacter pullistercoris]
MKIILQIGVVLAICLLGEGVSLLLPIPFPGSVIAMILLFLLLLSSLLRPEHIRQKSDFLLQNMAFFFIPAGVGIMEYAEDLLPFLLPLLLICVITTVLTFAASALTAKLVIHLQEKSHAGKEGE